MVKLREKARLICAREGAETVQMYLSDEKASLPRPAKELKGFEKVFLKPGESKTVRLPITEESLRFYHPSNRGSKGLRG